MLHFCGLLSQDISFSIPSNMKNTLGNLEKVNNEIILKKIFLKFGEFMNKIFKNQKLDEILDLKNDITVNKSKKKKKNKRKLVDDNDDHHALVSVFDFYKPNTYSSSSASLAVTPSPTHQQTH
jgi:hypothetical protein